MIFAEFPFVRYLPFFVVGIMLSSSFPKEIQHNYAYLLLFTFLFYALLILINGVVGRYSFKFWIPLLGFIQLLLAGAWVSNLQQVQADIDSEYPLIGVVGYTAVVIDHEQVKPNSRLNRVKVKEIFFTDSSRRVDLEVLLYHKEEETLFPGDLIWVSKGFQRIDPPLNPEEFHYQRFMARQGVYYRHFLTQAPIVLGHVLENPIEAFFQSIRFRIQVAFNEHFQDIQARQIANALLLGQKKDLDQEVSEAYATAGAMHILAVSGLHVGIIYGFFFLVFKPYRLTVTQRVLYLSVIILLIWAYAMLTGMSPSVKRAATMFTFVSLAQMKSRAPSIYNPIAISAFLLLLFDPNLLFAVGFQLSYLALLGILLIQPVLVRLWIPSKAILEYVWQITTVGIAAQIATFPLSALYFGIFPTYFMLSNLVAIPGAFLIMSIGVPYMLFSQVPVLAGWLAWLTEMLIRLMNFLIVALQYLPMAKLQVDWVESQTWLYLFVLCFILWIKYQPRKLPVWVLMGILFVITVINAFKLVLYKNDEAFLISYDLNRGEVIDLVIDGKIHSWENAPKEEVAFKVEPFRKALGIEASFDLQVLRFQGVDYLVFPKNDPYPIDSLAYLATHRWRFDGDHWTSIDAHELEASTKGAMKYNLTKVRNAR